MSGNPLSFFAAASSDEDSTSSSEENNDLGSITQTSESCPKLKGSSLPPPLQALATAKMPDFVTSHLHDDVDWDQLVKKPPYVPPKEIKPWESDLPAVESKPNVKDKRPDIVLAKQIPQTLIMPHSKPVDTNNQQNIVDHAIMWSKMYKDAPDTGSTKRPRPEDEDEDLVGFCHTDISDNKLAFQVKHQKVSESFRDKEKRKRNVGQANREKMFVEEEKRVLRQAFDDNY